MQQPNQNSMQQQQPNMGYNNNMMQQQQNSMMMGQQPQNLHNNNNPMMMQGSMMGQPPQQPGMMQGNSMMQGSMMGQAQNPMMQGNNNMMMNSGMMPNNNNMMMNSGMMQQPQQPGMLPPQQPGMMNPNQQQQQMMNGSMMSNSPNVMDRNPPTQPGVPSQPQAPFQQPTHGNINSNNNQARANSGAGSGMLGSRLARPAFLDPATNIMYETDQAEYEGWLTKQSMWLKDWRRRYVILKGNKLFFAKNEYQAPHGMIDLAHCTTVKSADWKSKKRHSFEISTPEITYLLYADTESEKDDWIGRIGKAIVRCSRTYVPTSGPKAQTGGMGMGGGNPDGDSEEDDDDIYTNDDMENPYYND